MWLGVIFLFVLSSLLGLIASATELCTPKACSRTTDSEKAVCGSDGITYPTRCIFELIKCHNKNLTLSRRGQCRQNKTCSEIKVPNSNNTFIPRCRQDGTFDSEQCHLPTSRCWCVTPEGIPLPYTSWVKNKDTTSNCDRRKITYRRSPSRNNHKGRICKTVDKAQLNTNLINSFHSEYSRESGRNDSDSLIITWKFNTLDMNRDSILDKNEYKDLRRLVKKAIKPRKCAKQFPRNCDVDRDGLITLQEWDDCLAKDGVDALPQNNKDNENQQHNFDKLASPSDLEGFQNLTKQNFTDNDRPRYSEDGLETISKVKQDRSDLNQSSSNDNDETADDSDDVIGAEKPPPHGVLDQGMDPSGPYDSDSIEVQDDPTDCLSDRKTALSEGYNLYLPDCTPDGRYAKVQCYKSAGYCFCVNEDSGRTIPGTSVKNGIPKCDYAKTTTRIMKGCPENKKTVFLKDLLEYLHNEMLRKLNGNNSFNLTWIDSKEEQAAKWSFVVFDVNKNKILERNEWKSFKKQVEKVKKLKKCGKKLPRYCDINKDMVITMTEWLDCLNIQQADIPSISTPSPRMGKNNPLSMLKDD